MFVDLAKIYVKAGDGGRGCVSFRREKYVPKGGPDGGDGGKGGNIIIKSSAQLNTLLDQKYQQHYTCKDGGDGRGKQMTGHDSPDIVVKVPAGTIVRDAEAGEIIADLAEDGQEVIAAYGGRGGKGNTFFKSPTRQAPRFAQAGLPGEEKTLLLELKLLADAGLIGLPNAGKSTLISVISSARPKIADYPFTTLVPNLGVVKPEGRKSFVIADIPGLIEGAHRGAGLGSQFLRHVERTKILLHLVEVTPFAADPVENFVNINEELRKYNPELMNRFMVAVATKIDAGEEWRIVSLRNYCIKMGCPFFAISAVTHDGVDKLVDFVAEKLEELKAEKQDF